VKPIATVRSVEEFWSCYSHLIRPNELVSPSDYHLFKEGISPLWEDEANQKGGKWMVRLRKGLASEKWESLILALIGDSTGIGDEICGCVASIRYQEDIIAVWNRDGNKKMDFFCFCFCLQFLFFLQLRMR
jgi:translation initiation factor 4E